jgi:hypothetical protein
VDDGLIDAKSSIITDVDSGKKFDLHTALAVGLIDGTTGEILSKATGEKHPIVDAVRSGLVEPVIPSEKTDDKLNGDKHFIDMTGTEMSMDDVLSSGLVDGETSKIKHPTTGEIITLNQALEPGTLTDDDRKKIMAQIKEKIAAHLEEKDPLQQKMTIIEAINAGFINRETGLVSDPRTQEVMTIQ